MSSNLPIESTILQEMKRIIPQVNIEQMSIKQFIAKLSEVMGVDLHEHREYIKATLANILNNEDEDQAMTSDDGGECLDKEVEEDSKVQRTKSGWAKAKKELSPQLADFLGKTEETSPQVIKFVWAYIKTHNLMNPENRKEIQFDDRLKAIFKVEGCSMAHLAKYVCSHMHPFKPVDLQRSSDTSRQKKEKKRLQERKAAEKEYKKRKAYELKMKKLKKMKKQSATPKERPPPKLYVLSEDLRKVVGEEALPYREAQKRVWDYVEKNNLKNPYDGREVICDELLKKVMAGNKTVTIFNWRKYLSSHLVLKQDDDETKDN